MQGEYKEQLPIGFGNLIVTKEDFYIEFEFAGPDQRYNKELLRIYKNNIDSYIDAFKINCKKYLELKEMSSLLGEEFSTKGLLQMDINIGKWWSEGVCLYKYNRNLSSEEQINEIINSLLWVKEKGPKVMKVLNEN